MKNILCDLDKQQKATTTCLPMLNLSYTQGKQYNADQTSQISIPESLTNKKEENLQRKGSIFYIESSIQLSGIYRQTLFRPNQP